MNNETQKNTLQQKFAKNLRDTLEKRNMSQRELSRLVGTSEPSISRYLNGERVPDIITATVIVSALNITLNDLLGISEAWSNYKTVKNHGNDIKVKDLIELLCNLPQDYMITLSGETNIGVVINVKDKLVLLDNINYIDELLCH